MQYFIKKMEDNKKKVIAQIPSVVKFAFKDLKLLENDKWSAKCNTCGNVLIETRKTTSAFTK